MGLSEAAPACPAVISISPAPGSSGSPKSEPVASPTTAGAPDVWDDRSDRDLDDRRVLGIASSPSPVLRGNEDPDPAVPETLRKNEKFPLVPISSVEGAFASVLASPAVVFFEVCRWLCVCVVEGGS